MRFCGANKKAHNLQLAPNLHRLQGTGYDLRSFPSFPDQRIFPSVDLSRRLVPAFSNAKGVGNRVQRRQEEINWTGRGFNRTRRYKNQKARINYIV